MSKELIISVNGREKKIAIVDNGKVTEFYIERGEENAGIAGNIYKGRVQRVLPGMQSAFVSIGLERDAFLYVSDFFDEEEEIERIVMEKSKKKSPEEAKKEADEQIERSRIEREKQMESVQDIAEPIDENGEKEADDTEKEKETERKGRGRGRGKRGKDKAEESHTDEEESPKQDERSERSSRDKKAKDKEKDKETERGEQPAIDLEALFEEEDSDFERIVDDEDTGEMFKDAFRQEAIVDIVRAVEFDMETTPVAEVGSVLGSVDIESEFERIADEDEEAAPAKPKRATRSRAAAKTEKKPKAAAKKTRGKAAKAKAEAAEDDAEETKPAKETKAKPARKTTRSRTKKAAETDADAAAEKPLEDAEASEKEPSETAEMAVRRGGRGRRRGGKGRSKDQGENGNGDDGNGHDDADPSDSSDDASKESGNEDNGDNGSSERSGEDNREKKDGRRRRGKDDSKGRSDSKRNDRNDRPRSQPTISDLLREGQEILVQIAKEPIARKGARITSHIALPGRYLVYMPTIEHLGVSRKIESSNERGRLRTLIQRIRSEEDIPSGGFIVRTAGVGISEDDLRQDARYLVRTWLDIRKSSEKAKSPALVHQDLDIVQRILRDQFSDDFSAIRVDSEEEYLRTIEFINRIQPRMVNRVKLYTRDEPILDYYGVQEEIDKALKPRVWLKSGGYLVINQTEALVAIDVNTGKFVGKGNARLEDTITRTNMEAVEEIARQIRLRDLGGIIVLDLIDMEDRRNRHKVSQALQEALSTDKSPTKVLSFNDFGLIIMTRKRVKQSLERTMCAPCDYCEGSGWIKSPTTVCYELLSEARRLAKHMDDVRQTTLRVHPDVAKALRSSEKEVFDEIEAYLGSVDLNSDKTIHQEQFDFAFV